MHLDYFFFVFAQAFEIELFFFFLLLIRPPVLGRIYKNDFSLKV